MKRKITTLVLVLTLIAVLNNIGNMDKKLFADEDKPIIHSVEFTV